MPDRNNGLSMLTLIGLLAAVSGCADGPVPEMRSLNPWVRKQWAEDETFGPTYYARVEALQSLRAKAGSLPPEEREQVAAELSQQLAAESAVPMKLEMLRTLAAYNTTTAEAAIVGNLQSENADVRRVACEALARQKGPQAVTALGQVVGTDTDADVRKTAARGLQQFQDPAAAQALRVALDEDDPAMQKIAMDSLRSISGRDYGNDPSRWREYLQGGEPAPAERPSIASSWREWSLW